MTIDCHIKFDDVEGETTDDAHDKEITVLGWNWGVVSPANLSNGGLSAGQAVPQELVFKHNYDKASPTLAKMCIDGHHFGNVVLTTRKSGAGAQDYIKITMKDAFITSVMPSAAQDGEVVEHVTLMYKDIEHSYKPQKTTGGALDAEVKTGWDLKTKKTR